MLKVPFFDDDARYRTASEEADASKRRSQQVASKGMKTFGAQQIKDYDCMNQANFVALAMERRRRRHTEEIIHHAARKLTELFHPSTLHTDCEQGQLTSAVLDLMEMRHNHDDISSVASTSSDSSKRTSEIEFKDYGTAITSRQSWQSFQDFSDVLKSEALQRRMRR
ncbi:hypothetical protein IV203_013110 [Nitzschia inconspicua]|uniref:Uncharacterized protein n=1 Tax=Nitzschia inconspicua TaxID=303405 RepID=A0A9K3M5B8_9STRA|nr:hypothetical protein IV203_013110 [Nitzschia inconspicua]